MAPHPNARTARVDEERHERRRRKDSTLDRMAENTMAVPDAIREANPDRNFRWVNDSGNRMHNLTSLDDWDRVEGVEPLSVGTDRDGKPMKAYLCSKPTDFVLEDEKTREAHLREQEKGLIQGERDAAAKSDLPDTVSYTPGKNSINRAVTTA